MIEASRLGFDPVIGWTALVILGVLALIVWLLYAVRGGRSWLLRALALTLITAALSNPLWIRENRDPLKSTLAVVVDQSSSMNVNARTSLAREAAEQLRTILAKFRSVI